MTEKATAAVATPSSLADRKRTATAQSWRKDRGPRANKRWTEIHRRYELLRAHLDERARRCWAGAEAAAYGRGGISVVSEATGLSTHTVTAGLREVNEPGPSKAGHAIRRGGAGRKRLKDSDPHVIAALEALTEPAAHDPRLLRWTPKSLRALSRELHDRGHHAGPDVVGDLLRELGYRLRSNVKTIRTRTYPGPSLQFERIGLIARRFLDAGLPVISVDVSAQRAQNLRVDTDHSDSVGADLIGVDTDDGIAGYAVHTVGLWWRQIGRASFPHARNLLITMDAGGAVNHGARMWKATLQSFADESGLRIDVCHFPPATRRWNRIEHRMADRTTVKSSKGVLIDREVDVSLIGNMSVSGNPLELPPEKPPKSERTAQISRIRSEWNYTVRPRARVKGQF